MDVNTFLAIFLPVSFSLGGLLIYYARNTDRTVTQIQEQLRPVGEMMNWIQQRGLQTIFISQSKEGSHSLPPGKAARRDELLGRAKAYGLTQVETTELKNLLQEDARDDLVKGVISFLAFLGIMAAIIAFVSAITKK